MYLKDDEIQKEQQEKNGVERRQVLTQHGEDLGMGGGRERYIGCDAHYSKTHSVGDHVCGLDIREQKSGYIEATVGEGGQKVAVEQHQVVLVDGRGNVVLLAGEDMLDPVRHLGVREERKTYSLDRVHANRLSHVLADVLPVVRVQHKGQHQSQTHVESCESL